MAKELVIQSFEEFINNTKFSKIIPLPGVYAMLWFGRLYIRKQQDNKIEDIPEYIRKHEYAHYLQLMQDYDGSNFRYYASYIWEWIEERFKYRTHPMEDEANAIEFLSKNAFTVYTQNRKKHNWKNYDEN